LKRRCPASRGEGWLLVAALASLALLAFVGPASGRSGGARSCIPQSTINGASFDYVICDLVDLDQVRQVTPTTVGLPGNGHNYCVPTATMDALAYFASHGVPSLRPGDKDWTDPANYNEMSTDIHDLGDLMGTTAAAGTGDGYFDGLDAWLAQFQPGVPLTPAQLLTSHLWATSPDTSVFAPTLQQMADDAIAGNIVIPNIAFMQYEKPPAPANGPKQWLDVGGHVITMSSAHSPSTMGLHDPALPWADHAYQSPYAEETYTVTPVTSTFGYIDSNGDDQSFTATMLRVDNYALDYLFGAGTEAYIWGYTVLEPETVQGFSINAKQIAVVLPWEPVESDIPTVGPVSDLVIDPTRAHDFYTAQGSSTIWDLDLGSGASTRFADAGAHPDAIAFAGRARTLFAAANGHITAFDARGGIVGGAAVGEHVDALVADHATGRLFALSTESRRLRVFDSTLALLGTFTLPRPAVAGSGRTTLALRGGMVYVHRDGSSKVAQVSGFAAKLRVRLLGLKGARHPLGLAVDDAGHVFVQVGGRLAEYLPSGKPLKHSLFTGRMVGPGLAVARSFRSASPAAMHFVDFVPQPS
jgi:hypothetical protein